MVAAREGGEACVCDLTEPLGLTQPTISHHLKILVEAGIFAKSLGSGVDLELKTFNSGTEAIAAIHATDVRASGITTRTPTLDDVYLQLTGSRLAA